MSIDISILWIIIGCAVVTFIPRIVPFIVVRNMKLPNIVTKWLSFIPICIFAALIMDSILSEGEALLSVNWHVLIAVVPTCIIALWTKNLSVTVIVGIVSMAVVRQLM